MAEKPHYSKKPCDVTAIGGGMEFLSGEGEPPSDVGRNGDVYLNTLSGDLYKNSNDTWTLQMNLVGQQGPKGEDGKTLYTWFMYADDDKGAGMSDSPSGKRYLGLAYNKTTPTKSTNPADYKWSPLYDNVQVGGRNLVKNSKGPFISEPKNTGDPSDNYNHYRFYCEMELNETYTLSADIEITHGDFDKVTVYPYPGGKNGAIPIPSNGRIKHTFVKTSETIDSVLIYAGRAGLTRGQGIIIRNVKLEKGNVATDWTPAPEDVPRGPKGADGRGVANITYDKETGELVFNMTDSTDIRVAVPPTATS